MSIPNPKHEVKKHFNHSAGQYDGLTKPIFIRLFLAKKEDEEGKKMLYAPDRFCKHGLYFEGRFLFTD